MKKVLIALAGAAALALAGCSGWSPRPTRVTLIAPNLWHIESDGGAPETWLLHTCATKHEAILRFAPTRGDEGYGIDVWCVVPR